MRDASFSVYALLGMGFTDEAAAFGDWLRRRVEEERSDGSGPLKIMYRVDGSCDLTEETLDHFDGYLGSRPVRVGNAASDQLQLDIYGEAMNSIHALDSGPLGDWGVSHDGWNHIVGMMDWLCEHWRWNDHLGAFVQYGNSDVLDASLVLMPLLGFIRPNDPRWQSTMSAMDKTLVEDSLVYRYDPGALAGRSARVGGHLLAVHLPLRRCARPLRPARRRPADVLEDADLRQPSSPRCSSPISGRVPGPSE